MLTRLKFKCLVILESVLEGNDDNNILRKIIKAIPVDCIKWNLGIIYEKYRFIGNKQYSDELFNNQDIEYEDIIEDERVKERAGMIIEIGFKMFYLLKKYQELEKSLLIED